MRVLEWWTLSPNAGVEECLAAIEVVQQALPHPKRPSRRPSSLLDPRSTDAKLEPGSDAGREPGPRFGRPTQADQALQGALLDSGEIHGGRGYPAAMTRPAGIDSGGFGRRNQRWPTVQSRNLETAPGPR